VLISPPSTSTTTNNYNQRENKALLKLSPGRRSSPLRILLIVILISLFVLSCLSYITGQYYLGPKHWFIYLNKPLPIFILLFLLPIYGEYYKKTLMYSVWIEIGLLFCWVSDLIMMFNNEETNHLVGYGLAASLIGKICYTVAFTVGVGKEFKFKFPLSIPFYAFGGLILFLIRHQITQQFVYFVIYVFFECSMGWRSLALTSEFPGSDRTKLLLWFSAVGSALLIASDTLVILNEFNTPLAGEVYYASLIYWSAQLFIALSVPRRLTRSDYWLDQLSYINPFVKQ